MPIVAATPANLVRNFVEFSRLDENCSFPEHLRQIEFLTAHISSYLKYFGEFSNETPVSDQILSYPKIYFIDCDRNLTYGELLPSHIDFSERQNLNSQIPNDPFCVESIREDAGHGIFNIGMLLAKRNGYGLVGLLPELDVAQVRAFNAPYTNHIGQAFQDIEIIAQAPDFGRVR